MKTADRSVRTCSSSKYKLTRLIVRPTRSYAHAFMTSDDDGLKSILGAASKLWNCLYENKRQPSSLSHVTRFLNLQFFGGDRLSITIPLCVVTVTPFTDERIQLQTFWRYYQVNSVSVQSRSRSYSGSNNGIRHGYDRWSLSRRWIERESLPECEDVEQKTHTEMAKTRETTQKKGDSEGLLPSVSSSFPRLSTNSNQIRSMLRTSFGLDLSSSSSERRKSAKSVSFATLMECKEVSGRQYDWKMCASIPHPIVPQIAEFEKAKLWMVRWFKMMTTMSAVDEKVRTAIAILDIGAGPRLVRKDTLSKMWLENV